MKNFQRKLHQHTQARKVEMTSFLSLRAGRRDFAELMAHARSGAARGVLLDRVS